jgi:LemA protein
LPQVIIPAIFVLVVFVGWVIGSYNRFIKYRNKIEEAWSGIDVALKRRYNLIPNLIRAIEGYGEHEAKIFQATHNYLPGSNAKSERVEEESQISKSLGGLLALAEAYPDLKASANFLDLQKNLDEIEEDIQKARNQYNRYVDKLNTQIESFPANLIARKFGFEKQNYFTLELATQRELPEVEFFKFKIPESKSKK